MASGYSEQGLSGRGTEGRRVGRGRQGSKGGLEGSEGGSKQLSLVLPRLKAAAAATTTVGPMTYVSRSVRPLEALW